MARSHRPETRIVHGAHPTQNPSRDLVPPIHMTSTFTFRDAAHGADLFQGGDDGFIYTRIGNPTTDLLQQKVAVLEGGADAIATASGMAAVASVAMTLAAPGDSFVSCSTLYGGTFALFQNHLRRLNIDARFISPREGNARSEVEQRISENTRFLYMETPANPTLNVIDIALWADIAHARGIPLVVDNTFASPYLQAPLKLGAAIVIHSATKYLGGHGDLIGGVITGSTEMMQQIREAYTNHFGPAMSPFNAWLILRGIKTLALRMNRHCQSAAVIAQWLEEQPWVSRVHYPGLPSHPEHRIAKRQMTRFGGMIAFELTGGIEAGRTMMDKVELCALAVSLGDCESLIQHPASMTHATYSPAELKAAGIDAGLIRLSVGLEDPEDIKDDLARAAAA